MLRSEKKYQEIAEQKARVRKLSDWRWSHQGRSRQGPTAYKVKLAIILGQTYNATLFSFDYFYVKAHGLSNLFHSTNSSFSQASNHVLVLTICPKLAKKQLILSMKGGKKK